MRNERPTFDCLLTRCSFIFWELGNSWSHSCSFLFYGVIWAQWFVNEDCAYSMLGALSLDKLNFLGPVSTPDNRVFNGPFGRSLRSFAHTAHLRICIAALHFTMLAWLASLTCSFQNSLLISLFPSWYGCNSWICVHAVIAINSKKRVIGRH